MGKDKVFERGVERNLGSVVKVFGDRPMDGYVSSDAANFKDYLLKRGLITNSVKRTLATIRSVINLAIQEHGLDYKNGLFQVFLPILDDAKRRKPKSTDVIRKTHSECVQVDDEAEGCWHTYKIQTCAFLGLLVLILMIFSLTVRCLT